MKNKSVIALVLIMILISISVSQEVEKKKEWLSFKLKYEKGMKFTKKITNEVINITTDDEGTKKTDSKKEVSFGNITIEEVDGNLPKKMKYEFGKTEVYENDKKNKKFVDKLKGHWFDGEVDDKLNVTVNKKSDDFPDNEDSKYFFEELKRHGFLRFDFTTNIFKQEGDTWTDSVVYYEKKKPGFKASMLVNMTFLRTETEDDTKIAFFTFTYTQPSDFEKTTYSGSVDIDVVNRRIISWKIEIEIDFGEESTRYFSSCEFTYEDKEKNIKEKKDELKPKTDDE